MGIEFYPPKAQDEFDWLTSGQETLPRELTTTTAAATGGSQNLRLSFFTARKSFTTTQARVISGGTAAGATPTLVRFGLYSVATDGSGTLVAATVNDTTLLSATGTAYAKAWSASTAVVVGRRYAFGLLIVSAAAMPTLVGAGMQNNAEAIEPPRLVATLSGQADLPASFAAGSLGVSGARHYAVILP